MQVAVNDQKNPSGEQAVENVKKKIATAFSKFGLNINSVESATLDPNGPRGGVDKVRRVLVKLTKMEDVIASVEGASLSKAISRWVNRA